MPKRLLPIGCMSAPIFESHAEKKTNCLQAVAAEAEISRTEPVGDSEAPPGLVEAADLAVDQVASPEILGVGERRSVVTKASLFLGPIPPPETLEGYNKVIPNGADRVMKMAEREQGHRHKMDSMIVGKESFEKRVGLVFAFILAAFALGVSAYLLIWTDKSTPGLTLFIVQFAGLSWAFLGAKRQKRSDEDEESED